MKFQHGIELKKKYGQHFLRNQTIADSITKNVSLTSESSVFEIGGGDGFLTRTILHTNIKRLWVFEIDREWAEYLKKTIQDKRLTVFLQNFLDLDFSIFEPYKPWT
jgi:16S rRNA (adenine1518-N6/adenine1519-N6)-dimethyltransferase